MQGQKLYSYIKEQVRIEDYAAQRLGYTVVRKGKYLSLREHDSVIIDPSRNCFWRNSRPGQGKAIGHGGSIIDFVMEFTEKNLHETLKELSEEVLHTLPDFRVQGVSSKRENRPGRAEQILRLPPRDRNMHNVFAYLIQTRKINPDIVQELVDRKQLYQDTNKNCVFIGYDWRNPEKAVFACRRGTNTKTPFYGDAVGCDYTQCFYFHNQAARLYVTECVIDALSVMTLKKEQRKDFDYLALAGVGKADCISTYLDRSWKEIWIGMDQDDPGRAGAEILKTVIRGRQPETKIVLDLPETEGMDWNQVLQGRTGSRGRG